MTESPYVHHNLKFLVSPLSWQARFHQHFLYTVRSFSPGLCLHLFNPSLQIVLVTDFHVRCFITSGLHSSRPLQTSEGSIGTEQPRQAWLWLPYFFHRSQVGTLDSEYYSTIL